MAATPFKVKAVFDYTSGHDDDLSFNNGQIITITDVEDDDWYYGEYADAYGATKQGLFPKNFVEKYEPVTPPRPSRPPKREQDQEPVPEPQTQPPSRSIPQAAAKEDSTEATEDEEDDDNAESGIVSQSAGSPEPTVATLPKGGLSTSKDLPTKSPAVVQSVAAPAPEPTTRAVPPPTATSKSPPPVVADKPASSSFRDRIAAFNKPAAPPVAPLKPGQTQGSSFIKKPFVPPPPSRNAYVPIPKEPPPQRVYRREEGSDLPDPGEESVAVSSAPITTQDGRDDQPKPTSLKERIALLQQQQLEQAARHAELASKKEKPQKPPSRKQPEVLQEDEAEAAVSGNQEHVSHEAEEEDAAEEGSSEAPRPSHTVKSRDRMPITGSDSLMSDPNDADQSAGGDTEDGEPSANRRPPRAPTSVPRAALPRRQLSQENTVQHTEQSQPSDDDQEMTAEVAEEEDELDPEIRRRMEIRERMAKMSGGMGMAGMFGPPGGLPQVGPKKIKSGGGPSKKPEDNQTSSPPSQPVPIMALPGMAMPGLTKLKSPEKGSVEYSDDDPANIQSRGAEEYEESSEEEQDNSSRPLPPPPTERPVPAIPASRAVPPIPPAPTTRAVPPPPHASDTRPLPPAPAPSSQFLSAGEDSDDELSTTHDGDVSNTNATAGSARQPIPPPVPVIAPNTGSGTAPISPVSPPRSPSFAKSSTFPQDATGVAEKRISRQPPPIPGAVISPMSSPPAARAPPPPPPPTRDDNQTMRVSDGNASQEESEEITEYEGDYDTDIAAGDLHKDALTADQGSSADETLTGDEASYHHSGLPSIGPPPGVPPVPGATAPRGAPPPPPPREPARPIRQSSDLPRPPPPPPPGQAPSKQRQSNELPRGVPPPVPQHAVRDDEYDPYNYSSRPSFPTRPSQRSVERPTDEGQLDGTYASSLPRTMRAPPLEPPSAAPSSSLMPQISTTTTRQSLDTSRAGQPRVSVDARPSMDNTMGYMAHEIDVGRSSHWWTQRKMPPPSIQDRPDIAYEMEESTAIQQDGSELVLKHVYILFMDYSQTILTARYSQADPSKAEFSQRYEAPPAQLRQDQLEAAHHKFGARMAEKANQQVNHIVGNGTPMALISELLHNFADVVPAVGTRAFGAVVYANMANATVQQLDEIRTGDIISFRNTKMQGHKGPMKQKYNIDVGKPDHVAIVVDWDGTKKKIRAWEQGRESKKVKIESFKLGDIKSGEVKIWRVVGRDWIGWGNKS